MLIRTRLVERGASPKWDVGGDERGISPLCMPIYVRVFSSLLRVWLFFPPQRLLGGGRCIHSALVVDLAAINALFS